jgi:hypothetical protein
MSKTASNSQVKPKTRRVRSLPTHQSFRLTKKKLAQPQPLPSIGSLTRKTYQMLTHNKRLFGGIALVYVLLSFVLVQGLGSNYSLDELKQQIEEVFGEESAGIGTSFVLFGYLLGSASAQAGEQAAAYQMFLSLITILGVIWAARQVLAGEKPTIRDVFYKGMYPLIPFILVMLVIALQLVPLAIGNFLYASVIQEGIAITALERGLWLLLVITLSILSLYLLASSLFALYITTLPDMTPMKALRSARELVMHRRLKVFIRILAFPLILLILATVIFLPLLMFMTVLAQPLFLLASGLGIVAINVYMYNLYRALL